MQRITISMDDKICEEFDKLIERRGYKNRSEAFRDLTRRELAAERLLAGKGESAAVVSYIYDHHKLQLSSRMVDLQHRQGNLVVSSLHVHVSNADCIEAVVLRGPAADLKKFADTIIAERGIEHGVANIITISDEDGSGHHHHHHHSHDAEE